MSTLSRKRLIPFSGEAPQLIDLSVNLLTILLCRLILGKLVASRNLLNNIKISRIVKYSPNWVHREFLVN